MSLRLYDTYTRAIRDFQPLQPGKVSIYVCGATVQSPPHVGHIRVEIAFDQLRRWLLHRGNDVVYVRNVTDIEDKVLAKAATTSVPWWVLAYENERAFAAAYDLLGVLPATLAPRATGHVPEIIGLIQRLIDSGNAYASRGDVFFDVRSFPDYGALSGQKIDEVQPDVDIENASAKQDPRDFALWKGAKPGEPCWDSPWGQGRPGWHIECSAMSTKYLGPEFDIHGAGIDLVFPHHENEIAQSRAAGDPFARYWLHNAWVAMAGEKMSKSLGNTALVFEASKRFRPVELRFYLGSAHYRSMIEFSEDALREAAAAYHRLESFAEHAVELLGAEVAGPIEDRPALPTEFVAAMDDDLGVPQALAVVYNAVRDGNTALAADDKETVRARLAEVRAMLSVLGMDPLDPRWRRTGGEDQALRGAVDRLVRGLVEQREAARANRDWATADTIRDQIRDAGIELTDTPHGARWSLRKDG